MTRIDGIYLELRQARSVTANKKENSHILDEFVKTISYHRKHATAVLNSRRQRVKGPIRRP